MRSTSFSPTRPASIGPPDTKIAGTLTRRAARNMPGMILSQLGTQIIASNWWASIMDWTQSAMSSRLGREYFMPSWPMAMPSQMAMVLNRIGVPPAWRTFSLRKSPTASRWTWPGTMSV